MTNSMKGLCLMLAGSVTASFFLTSFKLAAGSGDQTDATLVMLAAAAVLNSVTSSVQEGGRVRIPFDRISVLLALALSALTLFGNECAVGAVARISPPLTSVLQQTQILFVALAGILFLHERLTVRFWVGTAVAGAGLALLQLAPGGRGRQSFDALGGLLAVGSAASFGAMAIITRMYIHRIRPVAVNALRLWMSLGLWFLVHGRLPHLPMRPDFVAYCSLAGAFGPFLSRTAIMYALSYVPPTQTTLVGLLTPVVTLVPAFLAFGTVPTARELVGGAIMLGGISLPVIEQLGREPTLVADSETSISIQGR
jgi:drug/metabolite transporter (DMT)-like permease